MKQNTLCALRLPLLIILTSVLRAHGRADKRRIWEATVMELKVDGSNILEPWICLDSGPTKSCSAYIYLRR